MENTDRDGQSAAVLTDGPGSEERKGPDSAAAVTSETAGAGQLGENEAGQEPEEERLRKQLDASLAEAELLRGRLAEAERREAVRIRTEAVKRYFAQEGLPEEAAQIALYCLKEEISSAGEESGGGSGLRLRLKTDEAGNLSKDARAFLDGLMEQTLAPLKELKELKELRAMKENRDRNGGESGGPAAAGIPLAMPPVNAGFGGRSKEEILSIRDGVERRRAIADNPAAFGIG